MKHMIKWLLPHGLVQRRAQKLDGDHEISAARLRQRQRRLQHLTGTCAAGLKVGHIDTLELVEFAIREGARVYYDIGANVGTWTLMAKALAPGATIYGFEPMEQHIAEFQKATKTLPNVHLVPRALGSKSEERMFFPTSFSDASSFLPLNPAGKAIWNIANVEPIPLQITPLDQVVAEMDLPTPDLIKMDVQGFELEVLRGAAQVLDACQWIITEASFTDFYEGQCRFGDLVRELEPAGFEVEALGVGTDLGKRLHQADVLFGKRRGMRG